MQYGTLWSKMFERVEHLVFLSLFVNCSTKLSHRIHYKMGCQITFLLWSWTNLGKNLSKVTVKTYFGTPLNSCIKFLYNFFLQEGHILFLISWHFARFQPGCRNLGSLKLYVERWVLLLREKTLISEHEQKPLQKAEYLLASCMFFCWYSTKSSSVVIEKRSIFSEHEQRQL